MVVIDVQPISTRSAFCLHGFALLDPFGYVLIDRCLPIESIFQRPFPFHDGLVESAGFKDSFIQVGMPPLIQLPLPPHFGCPHPYVITLMFVPWKIDGLEFATTF